MVETFVTDGLYRVLLADETASERYDYKRDVLQDGRYGCNTVEYSAHVPADLKGEMLNSLVDDDNEQESDEGHADDCDPNTSEDSDVDETMDRDSNNRIKKSAKKLAWKPSLPNIMDEQRRTSAQALGDFEELQDVQVSMIKKMLSSKLDAISWVLGELFMARAAIVKLKSLFHSPNVLHPVAELREQQWMSSMGLQVGVANRIVQEVAQIPQLKGRGCLMLVMGVVKFLEAVGNFLPFSRPTLSPTSFVDLIKTQLVLHGVLASRIELMECTKSFEELKLSLQSCFKALIKKPLGLHFHLVLQTVEQSLLNLWGRPRSGGGETEAHSKYSLLGGIECLMIILDAVSGAKRLQILSRYSSRYLAACFNLMATLQFWYHAGAGSKVVPVSSASVAGSPAIYESVSHDAAKVLWRCIDILVAVSSREVIFPMKGSHVAQAMSCPAALFKPFYQRNLQKEKLMQSIFTGSERVSCEVLISDDPLFVDIYMACCKLLRNLLRHRTRESGHCVALLGESLRALLFFLEVMELSIERAQHFTHLSMQATTQCASWLRRVYEEVAEHKDTLGSYVTHILSDYICIIAGYGMSVKGLSRAVEASIRPGAYALIDICTTDDLQQLHAVLGEGPRRGALTALRRDYEQRFKYTGKV